MVIKYYEDEIIEGEKSLFLAGPSTLVKGITWRNEALKILQDLEYDGVVYVPEFRNVTTIYDADKQFHWERKGLFNSTSLIFWIPRKIPEILAMNTNVEFGYWVKSSKVLYGRPDESDNNEGLDMLYRYERNLEPHNKLEDLLKEAIK